MDPFTVISVFKDAYLTAKFIRNTASSIKHFRSEQSGLVIHLNVQILRLKNFSRLFRAVDGSQVDMALLETVPNQYLQTVHDVLKELQNVLAEYTKIAATLDEDYKKYSPLSPHFKFDPLKALQIDDVDSPNEPETDGEDLDGKLDGNTSEMKGKRWSFLGLRLGSSKARKLSSNAPILVKNLPLGVQWLFNKEQLEETLRKFREWNDDLKDLIAPLLSGFGFYEDKGLQKRLQPDGGFNMFQGHLELNNLAVDPSRGEKDLVSSNDDLLPWKDAESKMSEARVLVEYKQTGVSLRQDEEGTGNRDIITPLKELYAPQLARLLRAAGKHAFRTIPFTGYAWNPTQLQYAFLFNYPADAGDCEPQSLHGFILSSKHEPQFKFELKQRFHVAQRVARAIGAFHSDGWLHKSIRAHAVKFFFHKDGKTCDLTNPYLTDFEFSRPVAGVTRLAARAADIEHDVYRHPDRYGPPSASFSKIHDIYSLGVVLLEIGLWQTARQLYDDIVMYDLEGNPPPGGVPAKMIKETFIQDARERLAHRMGLPYQEAVISCLDGDWDDFVDRDFASEFEKRVVQKVDIKAFVGA